MTAKNDDMTVLERKAKLASAILNDIDDDRFVDMEMLYNGLTIKDPLDWNDWEVLIKRLHKRRFPHYLGREPTVEESAASFRSLTNAQRKRLLQKAGILDKDGNIAEMYRPE